MPVWDGPIGRFTLFTVGYFVSVAGWSPLARAQNTNNQALLMCGITGYRVIHGEVGPWVRGLGPAIETLRYRGPDDGGTWVGTDESIGLGHRRLAILDLSPLGHQPMASHCGNWQMVYNGEVYNFRDIRAELEPLGHHFSGTGDSEVILAAFAQWGPEAAKRFTGMFAIALWHLPTRCLHLVRDRLGVKPLYYRWDGKVLCFGSELKAIRAFQGWVPEIDCDALCDFLRYGYIADPRSIYRQVYKLPPAHILTLAEDGQPELSRYWNVLDHAGSRNGKSEDSLADELDHLMVSAFKYRMISDVPVGVFLSGGIDSSILAAILQRHGDQQIKTFTIGFDDPEYDESPFAAKVARHLGTEHHARILKVGDAKHLLTSWGDLYDEPFADDSGIPTLMVSQVAAEQVKVVLSADGGDELFSGYTSYAATLRTWGKIKNIPYAVRMLAGSAIDRAGIQALNDRFMEHSGSSKPGLTARTASLLARVGKNVSARSVGEVFENGFTYFGNDEITQLIGGASATRALADRYSGLDGEKLCLWDLENYMPGDILTKVDRATMRVSIEGREPMIDHRLVEFAFSLPFHLRQGTLGPKHLLKKVLYRYLPRTLVERPKRGFSVPVRQWLTTDLKLLVDEHLDNELIQRQGLFNAALVRGYVRRLRAGDQSVLRRVWLLVAFQMWHRRWMQPS